MFKIALWSVFTDNENWGTGSKSIYQWKSQDSNLYSVIPEPFFSNVLKIFQNHKKKHFFLVFQNMPQFSCTVGSDSLQPHRLQQARSPCPITNSQSLLKLMPIESVMPSNHLILCRPLLFPTSSFQASGFFQWVSSSHQVAKVLEFQLQHQSFQWTFRTDFL